MTAQTLQLRLNLATMFSGQLLNLLFQYGAGPSQLKTENPARGKLKISRRRVHDNFSNVNHQINVNVPATESALEIGLNRQGIMESLIRTTRSVMKQADGEERGKKSQIMITNSIYVFSKNICKCSLGLIKTLHQ